MENKLTKRVIDALETREKPYDVNDSQIKGFQLRVYPSGRKTFFYTYRNMDRKRQRITIGALGSVTAQQARDHAQKYAAQVSDGIDVQKAKRQAIDQAVAKRSNSLDTFIDETYAPWIEANQKSGQATINTIKSGFAEIMHLSLGDIDTNVIDKWRVKKKHKGLKPSTINRNVNALRGALSRAVEWGLLEAHPFSKIKDLKIDKSPKVRYLSKDEKARLMAALEARDDELKTARESGNAHRKKRGYELLPNLKKCVYADRMTPLVTLSIYTGMRRGELFDLEWKDVDFDQKFITVIGDIAKSNNTRHIPLNRIVHKTLKAWKKQATSHSGRVFPADDGGRLDNVRKSWTSILKSANITNFRWHDMRHDFASQLAMKDVALNTIRELCGHADLNTTLRYAHLAPSHKTEAVALLE